MRKFNVTGLCVPGKHYMVDITAKIRAAAEMVDEGMYFTVNRARQYGKTTMLYLLCERLSPNYLVLHTTFEGEDDSAFDSNESFCRMFVRLVAAELEFSGAHSIAAAEWSSSSPTGMADLSASITRLCRTVSTPVVLVIDEVDKTSNNRLFLNFLGMLRAKYLRRDIGKDTTFHSAILAGVHDIKNLKQKITSGKKLDESNEPHHNSPWNIADGFPVDMSFKPDEIETMLESYENDLHTGMSLNEVSARLYRFTNGYPFLVSQLCKIIDEKLIGDWTAAGVDAAAKLLLKESNTLFDDLFKNIEANPRLYDLVYDIVIDGADRTFAIGNPEIELGRMLGVIVERDGKAAVSNIIFEMLITNYLVSKNETKTGLFKRAAKGDAVENGLLNLQSVLEKFSQHCHELYDERNMRFLEKHGRLLFITYLKPFLNGSGFCHIESETRDTQRMDLVIDYGPQQFIVELKLWDGVKMHEEAYGQLCGYLDAKNAVEGYLLTFDFRKTARGHRVEWVETKGKRIFDVIV